MSALHAGLKVTCPFPDGYLRERHGVIAGVTIGTLVRPTRLAADDTGWLVEWGLGGEVRCDPSELTVLEDHHANQGPALPSVVLDAFFEEMDARHWSTDTGQVDAARTATLERFRTGTT